MKLFIEHPSSVGETYWQHMWFALRVGTLIILVGVACVVHAFLPFLFTKTASNTISKLNERFKTRK